MNFIIKCGVSLSVRAHSTKWKVAQNSVLELCQATFQWRLEMLVFLTE